MSDDSIGNSQQGDGRERDDRSRIESVHSGEEITTQAESLGSTLQKSKAGAFSGSASDELIDLAEKIWAVPSGVSPRKRPIELLVEELCDTAAAAKSSDYIGRLEAALRHRFEILGYATVAQDTREFTVATSKFGAGAYDSSVVGIGAVPSSMGEDLREDSQAPDSPGGRRMATEFAESMDPNTPPIADAPLSSEGGRQPGSQKDARFSRALPSGAVDESAPVPDLVQLRIVDARRELERRVAAGLDSDWRGYLGEALLQVHRIAAADNDREAVVDALLAAFRPNVGQIRDVLTVLAPHVRRYLSGAATIGSPGWLATLTILGDLARGADHYYVYYHEVLVNGLKTITGSREDWDSALASFVANTMHNSCAQVLRELQRRRTTADVSQCEILERIRVCSAVLGPGSFESRAVYSFDDIERLEKDTDPRLLTTLNRLTSTTSFLKEGDRLVSAHIGLLGGLARLVLEREDVAVPMFNAGVDLYNYSREKGSSEKLSAVRVVANAIGIWAAGAVSGRATVDEVIQLEGVSSCIVNLFGAVPRVGGQPRVSRALRRVYGLVSVVDTVMPEQDRLRVRSSWSSLGLEPSALATEPPPTLALLSALSQLVTEIAELHLGTTMELPPSAESGAAVVTSFIRAAFAILPVDPLSHRARVVDAQAMLIDALTNPNTATERVRKYIEEESIPVRAGVFSSAEWDQLVESSASEADDFVEVLTRFLGSR